MENGKMLYNEKCPRCNKEVTLFWDTEKDGNFARCPYCGHGNISLMTEEEKNAAAAAALRLAAYERFKLWWMMTHGFTLKDMMQTIDFIDDELRETQAEGLQSGPAMLEALEEYGFDGGSIWPCYDEFLDHEYQMPDVMRMLLSPAEWELYARTQNVASAYGFSVSTPVGTISVLDKGNEEYPGVFVDFQRNGAGEDEVAPGCMMEYSPSDNAVVLRVYASHAIDEPTHTFMMGGSN